MPLTAWSVLLVACVDYNPDALDHTSDTGPALHAVPGVHGELTSVILGVPVPTETCNGLDDNGDGLIDEGFGDADHDGVADCLDQACDLDLDDSEPLDDAFECGAGGVTVTGELALDEVWSVQAEDGTGGCLGLMAADLDGDGRVELICSRLFGGIEVYSALTGERLQSYEGLLGDKGAAVVDADGDGTAEVWTTDDDGYLVGFDSSGTVFLRSAERPTERVGYDQEPGQIVFWPSEGVPALVGADRVISLHDGSTIAKFDVKPRIDERVLAVDADLDGNIEVFRGGRCFDERGKTEYVVRDFSTNTVYVRPVQADSDPAAEILWATNTEWVVSDDDGTVLAEDTFVLPANMAVGVPCIAHDALLALNTFRDEEGAYLISHGLNGPTEWAAHVNDNSTGIACAAFDADGDGVDDALVADEQDVRILGGAEGAELASGPARSMTLVEQPMVLDIDGDGTPEVITYSEYDWSYTATDPPVLVDADIIKVFHLTGVSADLANHWPIQSWTGTELNPDLTVPLTPRPSWLTTCAVPSQPERRPWGSDLVPVVVDSCTAGCDDGPVSVAIGVENWGPQELTAGAPVAVYTFDGLLLGVVTVPGWVDDASRSAGEPFPVSLADAQAGLVLVAGDDGTGAMVASDPDESNNRLGWRLNECD